MKNGGGRSRGLALLAGLALFLVAASVEASYRVLLIHTDTAYAADVQLKLMATGTFAAVDVYDATNNAPLPANLMGYDAVLVWTNFNNTDLMVLGNTLAAYIGAGHGVVMAMWNGYSSQTPSGNFTSYWLQSGNGTYAWSASTLGTVHEAGSPLLTGVTNFGCSGTSCYRLSTTLINGAVDVADWTDGNPLVIRGTINGHVRVDLNFYPPSDTVFSGNWIATGDGAKLMANALVYVAGGGSPIQAVPNALNFPDTGVGASAPQQTVMFTNTGAMPAAVSALTLVGANPGDFMLINAPGFPLQLQPGAGFSVGVGFSPTAGGMRSAVVRASLTGTTATTDVPLAGNGIGPKLAVMPTSFTFTPTPLGQAVPPISATITNSGGGQLQVSNVTSSDTHFVLGGLGAFPKVLAAGGSFPFTVTFNPTAAGVVNANLVVTSTDPANPTQMVPLVGTAGPPRMMLDTSSVQFAPANVGTMTAAATITVSNNGYSNLVVSDLQLGGTNPGDFALNKMTLPGTIPPGMSAPFSVRFAPTMTGARSATVTISSNDPMTPMKIVTLGGTATMATIMVQPNALTFPATPVGLQSAPATVTISDAGNGALNVTALTFSGAAASSFVLVNGPTLPLSIAANGSQQINVACAPKAGGNLSATLTVVGDVGSSAVALTCPGTVPHIQAAPASLDFGMVQVMMRSGAQQVTVSNTGADLHVGSITFTGVYAADFTSADVPFGPVIVTAALPLTFNVTFAPSVHGLEQAQIQIASDDPAQPTVSIPLKGQGVQRGLSVSPLNLDFGRVIPGQKKMRPVTLANTGDLPVTITNLVVGGTAAAQFTLDQSGPLTLAVGQSMDVQVTFTPADATVEMASLTVSATGFLDATVFLTGTGINPMSLTPPTIDFGSVVIGQNSGPATLTITNTSGSPIAIGQITTSDPQFVPDRTGLAAMIMPGTRSSFSVSFTPVAPVQSSAKVAIALAGEVRPLATVAMTGLGVQPASSAGGCSTVRGKPAAWPLLLLPMLLVLPRVALRRRRR